MSLLACIHSEFVGHLQVSLGACHPWGNFFLLGPAWGHVISCCWRWEVWRNRHAMYSSAAFVDTFLFISFVTPTRSVKDVHTVTASHRYTSYNFVCIHGASSLTLMASTIDLNNHRNSVFDWEGPCLVVYRSMSLSTSVTMEYLVSSCRKDIF